MKVVVFGDIHFPTRASDIPMDLLEEIKEENPDLLICTGDLVVSDVLEIIKSICDNLVIVRGNCDLIELPKRQIIKIGEFKTLVFHSSEVKPRGDLDKISEIGKRLGCDFVIFGHTHIPLFTVKNGIYLLNPGSLTGVISGEGISTPRSYAVLEVEGNRLKVEFRCY